jgi:ubiquinone/menaquinone biosynthesis C-methylase UbiE
MALRDEIRAYWQDPNTRSLIDDNMRTLEEAVVLRYLEPNFEIIDIGCGDGYSTFEYASRVKSCVGIEPSDYLRKRAEEKFAQLSLANTRFETGDIMDLSRAGERFDLAVTQRVLINLTSWDLQKQAIENVRKVLRPGGIYVMVENTYEGHDAMNDLRQVVGLPPLSKHWHNLYFHHEQLLEFLAARFHLIAHHTFSLYYLLTRVFMNQIASFEGFGRNAVKDPIFDKADPAARRLQEVFGAKVRVGDGPSFGAIQAFALRKLSEE